MAFEAQLKIVPGPTAGATCVDAQYHAILPNAADSGRWKLATATGASAWVQQGAPIAAGDAAGPAYAGITKMIVGTGGVMRGPVMCDAYGHAVLPAVEKLCCGFALAAGAAGDLVSVLLMPHWCPNKPEILASSAVTSSTGVAGVVLISAHLTSSDVTAVSGVTGALIAPVPIASSDVTAASGVTGTLIAPVPIASSDVTAASDLPDAVLTVEEAG